jgi:Tol biopolymer transport system component
VTVKSDIVASFWKGEANDPNKAERLTQGLTEIAFPRFGMDFSADGKILFASSQNGNSDIWVLDGEHKNPQQITTESSADYAPRATNDGRYIVFISNRSGFHNLWRIESNGNNPLQLTNNNHVYSPSISPDGKWIYYTSSPFPNSPSVLWKVSIEGGKSVKLTEETTLAPQISPDGKYVACYSPDASPDSKPPKKAKLTVLSADGKLIKQFPAPVQDLEKPLIWTPDSKAIVFWKKEKGAANFWRQPIESDTAKQMTTWETDEIFRMAYSKDGKQIAFERGALINDIVLIQNIEKTP